MSQKPNRMGGNAENTMNVTVNAASSKAHREQIRDDDAIDVALRAAENEGWNPRQKQVSRSCKWSLPARRAGVRHSLKPR
jgi:hypothetical protein